MNATSFGAPAPLLLSIAVTCMPCSLSSKASKCPTPPRPTIRGFLICEDFFSATFCHLEKIGRLRAEEALEQNRLAAGPRHHAALGEFVIGIAPGHFAKIAVIFN